MRNEGSRTIRGQGRFMLHAYHANSPTYLAGCIIGTAPAAATIG